MSSPLAAHCLHSVVFCKTWHQGEERLLQRARPHGRVLQAPCVPRAASLCGHTAKARWAHGYKCLRVGQGQGVGGQEDGFWTDIVKLQSIMQAQRGRYDTGHLGCQQLAVHQETACCSLSQ